MKHSSFWNISPKSLGDFYNPWESEPPPQNQPKHILRASLTFLELSQVSAFNSSTKSQPSSATLVMERFPGDEIQENPVSEGISLSHEGFILCH